MKYKEKAFANLDKKINMQFEKVKGFFIQHWRIIAALVIIVFLWYQYNLYLKEEEEKKKAQGTNEAGETCQYITYQDFQQKKANYYWAARNLDQTAINTIVQQYRQNSDGCDYRESLWRWAHEQVIKEGFCEADENDIVAL